MYLKTNKKEECTGCSACMNACPKNAISMIEDEEGFLYPSINKDFCIECGLCENVCHMTKENLENEIIELYGVKNKDHDIRTNSRSGGAFTIFSDYILKRNGVIYGAKLNEDFSITHERAEIEIERDDFRGSKYSQSDMQLVLTKIKEDLQNNRLVLFSGTPCQVAAINSFIPDKLKEKLYTVDIVCHGVPSPRIFRDYVKYVENKFNKKIKKFEFRDKSYGWDTHFETFVFEDATTEVSSIFRNIFYDHVALRNSCYECKYASTKRPSDITIGDFWGIDEQDRDFNDNKGVSIVLLNTQKGLDIYNEEKDKMYTIEADIEIAKKYNHPFTRASQKADHRDDFWKDYINNGIEYVINKYVDNK